MKRRSAIVALAALFGALVAAPAAAQPAPPYPWSVAWCQLLERLSRVPCQYTTPPAPARAAATQPNSDTPVVLALGFGIDDLDRNLGYAFVLENPNPDLWLEGIGLQINFYDRDGNLVMSRDESLWHLGPGERKPWGGSISLHTDETPAAHFARMEVFPRAARRVLADVHRGLPEIGPAAYRPLTNYGIAVGTIQNQGEDLMEDVRVSAVAYNAAGEIVGGGGATYITFQPGVPRLVEIPVHCRERPAYVELHADSRP